MLLCEALYAEGNSDNRYLFQGKELDLESGDYYFGARYYDAEAGRWTARDPKEQQFSSYVAFGNNPMKFIDPNGKKNIAAFSFMENNLIGRGSGESGYRDHDTRFKLGVENLPPELYCYDAVYASYRNTGTTTALPSSRIPSLDWFRKGGTTRVNGNSVKKRLVKDIRKGEKGDIVFMGEQESMKGHAVLLQGIDEVDKNTIDLYTVGAYSYDNPNSDIDYEVMRFEKNKNGIWINVSHGNSKYKFRGYGQYEQ